MRKARGAALIAVLLTGCGGGGSDDTAVSANPPASPPPVAAVPTPAAPAPSPVSEIPPAPEKPPTGPATPNPPNAPPPGPSISGEVLRKGLGDNYYEAKYMPWLVGSLETDATNQVSISQRSLCPAPMEYEINCFYSAGSAEWQNSGLESINVGGEMPFNHAYSLPRTLNAGGIALARSDDFTVQPAQTYPLNTTIAQWDAAPWFVQLQLQTDARSNTVFRMCWHYRLPSAIRLSCAKLDTITGDVRGIYVVDDSAGLGAKTWQTQ